MQSGSKTQPAPDLDGFTPAILEATDVDSYCRVARRVRHNELWWYYNGLARPRGWWKPFQARDGRWWYYVKPGFAWPLDYFEPIDAGQDAAPRSLLLGWQYPVPPECGDSHVWLNVIRDLSGYGLSRVMSSKRRAIRKGFRALDIRVANPADPELARQACIVWNSHVERTGWNTSMAPHAFVTSWRELADWPGTTVLTALDPERGNELCAWLIARIIDDTVFIDTIASHTDRLSNRPNDAIIFHCLASAARMGVRRAHYSLKSKLHSLEAFKESLGFEACPFPSRLHLRRPIGAVLQRARPDIFKRLQGDPVWSEHGRVRTFETESLKAETRSIPEHIRAESNQVAKSWFIAPAAKPVAGWQVFSLNFVLAALQGTMNEPQNFRRTEGWLAAARVVRALMAVAQAVLFVFAWIPVFSWFFEILARTWGRNAAGFFLRSCYWKAKLRNLGVDTLIDQGVEIWGPANVVIGSNCHIDTRVRLAAGERRHRQQGFISIGNYVHLGPGVHIAGRGGVVIEDYVGVSASAHLYSATNAVEFPDDPGRLISMSHMAPHGLQHVIEQPIVLEEYCFVGMMARIMPGVRVGRAAIVHANAELTQSVAPFANVGGLPRGRQIGWRKPRRPSPDLKSLPVPAQPTSAAQPTDAAAPAADVKRHDGQEVRHE